MEKVKKDELKKARDEMKAEIKARVEPHGKFVYFFERVFYFLQFLPPQRFIKNRVDSDDRRSYSELTPHEQKSITLKRVPKIDKYIRVWLYIEIACIFLIALKLNTGYVRWICVVIPLLRLVDILQININILIFDPIRTNHIFIASRTRLLINALINYFEIILLFGIFYNFSLHNLTDSYIWTNGFYFSVISQLTVGYGDIHPVHYFKIIATIQIIIGYLFGVLIIGSFLGILNDKKMEDIL